MTTSIIELNLQKLKRAEEMMKHLMKALKITTEEKFISEDYELDMWIHVESLEEEIWNIAGKLLKARQSYVKDLEFLRAQIEQAVTTSSEIFDFECDLTQGLYSRLHSIDDLIEKEEDEIQELDDKYNLIP